MKHIKPSNWRSEGQAPDYRFSLANERTYLSWIRTSLALLAGAVGIEHLVPEFADSNMRLLLSAILCVMAAALPLLAYIRWASNERAMRNGRELSYSVAIKVISIIIFLVAMLVIAMMWLP
ncbi:MULTISPECIES: YidH family protein [Vibrio]|uniref:YidH family protein n=1 Tax=Vibrio TaxID=662 RepID=UPI003D11B1B6